LDAHLRFQMRQEFRLLQQGYGVTTLFVTNDQEEAMVMADRIAVIDRGTIRQVGPPLELYQRPVDTFVAGFIGSISFFDARVTADAPGFWVEFGGHRVRAWMPALGRVSGDSVTVGIRPEDIVMDPAGMTVGVGRGSFLGSHGLAQVELAPGATVEMRTEGPCPPAGSEVKIRLCRLHIFDPRTGIALGRVEGGAS
jgi:ABC-type sugar transport system ATPase subunit